MNNNKYHTELSVRYSRIINRKVDDIHALKQNLDSLTEMDDIYDNDVDDDNKKSNI
jgi:hypothetical protein